MVVITASEERTILLIDNDPYHLNNISQALRTLRAGIKIESATSCEAARRLLEQVIPDLIVCEYQLPDGDCLALLERLRDQGARVPFVVCTALSNEDAVIRALNLGVMCYLKKEGDMQRVYRQLMSVIQNFLQGDHREGPAPSDRWFRVIFDAIGDAVHVVNSELVIILANKALDIWLEQLGFKRDDVINRHITEAFPFLNQSIIDEYHQVLRTGQSLVTVESTRIGDEMIWTETRKFPVREGDTVTHIVTIIRNIDREKKREFQLRESEERYRKIFDESNEGILIVDPHAQKIVAANHAMCEILGRTSEEILKMTLSEVRTAHRLSYLYDSTHTPDFERRQVAHAEILREDGSTRIVDVTLFTLIMGGRPHIASLHHDVTEDVLRQNALIKSEQWFRTIFENSPIPIAVFDVQGHMISANHATLEFAGVSSLEDFRDYNIFEDPSIGDRTRSHLKRGGGSIVRDGIIDYDLVRSRGLYPTTKSGRAYVRAALSTLGDQSSPQGYVLQLVDITELKRQREELSEFAHDMSHDLRAAIHNVLGYVSLSEMEGSIKYLPDIVKLLNRMTEILNRSVALADAGLVIGTLDTVSMNEIVQAAAERIPGVKIHSGRLPTVQCDRSRLEQVFENLFRNAVEHAQATNITVETVEDESDAICVLVRNDGRPISDNVRAHVFQKGVSTKPNGGLGLMIVKRIVEAHDWHISLDPSEPTTFRIRIPLRSIRL